MVLLLFMLHLFVRLYLMQFSLILINLIFLTHFYYLILNIYISYLLMDLLVLLSYFLICFLLHYLKNIIDRIMYFMNMLSYHYHLAMDISLHLNEIVLVMFSYLMYLRFLCYLLHLLNIIVVI